MPEADLPEPIPPEPASEHTASPATEPVTSELPAAEPGSGSVAEESPRG
jgi:hypothetical protein